MSSFDYKDAEFAGQYDDKVVYVHPLSNGDELVVCTAPEGVAFWFVAQTDESDDKE